MNLKLYWNKFIFLVNKNKILYLKVFLLSIFYCSYIMTISKFFTEYNFFSEGLSPDKKAIPLYILFNFPMFIFYLMTSFKLTKKITILNFIIYPFVFCCNLLGLMFCTFVLGGSYIWLYIIGFPILSTVFCLLIITGLIKDILTIKRLELNVTKIEKL